MESLWGEIQEIDQENKPEELIKKQFEYIYEETDRAVIGKVEKFDKTVDELLAPVTYTALNTMQTMIQPQAQNYLGEPKDFSGLTFEVFLTARVLPNYKYRFMFLQHGLMPYPTKVIVESTIAEQIGMEEKYSAICSNEEEFIQFLKKVLSSERVMSIVNRLNSYK